MNWGQKTCNAIYGCHYSSSSGFLGLLQLLTLLLIHILLRIQFNMYSMTVTFKDLRFSKGSIQLTLLLLLLLKNDVERDLRSHP